ncbi:zinc finger mym-type protein 2-like [Gigaspora margarita]|uniref:Zinc finger mym-type protein 2-like n=1 Tax=Gigaspora margarita TaxID=4874 RepID=A0A8H4AFS8_GIGMA|nr:zinc finger mym-type protein 2-like [Gigaspora margarita]
MPKANKSTLLNESNDEYTLDSNIETILVPKELESNLIYFFSYTKRSNKEEYSVNSVLLAIAAFQHYITENSALKEINIRDKQQFPTLNTLLNGKFKWLSAKDKGKTKGSESLTVNECLYILKHNCTSLDTPWDYSIEFFSLMHYSLL